MKKKQRRSYTTAFKVKIALEAIKWQRTINEIDAHNGVHPNRGSGRIFEKSYSKPKVSPC